MGELVWTSPTEMRYGGTVRTVFSPARFFCFFLILVNCRSRTATHPDISCVPSVVAPVSAKLSASRYSLHCSAVLRAPSSRHPRRVTLTASLAFRTATVVPPFSLFETTRMASSSQHDTTASTPPDQLASFHTLVDKYVHAAALCRHARAAELSAAAAEIGEALFGVDSWWIVRLGRTRRESWRQLEIAGTGAGAGAGAVVSKKRLRLQRSFS